MSFPQPLFILGSPRSFTSLLCAMLGRHPQAYGVSELNLFAADTLGELAEQMKGLRQFQMHGLLRVVAQLYTGEQSLSSIEMAQRWVLANYHRDTGEIYVQLCRRISPLMIIDKSPVYSSQPKSLERLYKTFPDAYFLHLIRHPRTQGKSMMNVADGMMALLSNSIDYSTDPPIVDPQFLWYRMQRNIMNFLERIPQERKLRLRGEDILGEPERYFKSICQWLNLEWSEPAYQAMLNPQDSPYACIGPYGAPLGNDPNFLRNPVFEQRPIKASTLAGPLPWRHDGKGFTADVIELAQALGYE